MTTETSFDIRPAQEEEAEQPNRYRSNVRPAPYRIPAAPPIAWAAGNSARRAWVSRLLLACLLILQAVLTLRLRNSASPLELNVLPDYRFGGDFTGGSSLYPSIAQALENGLGLQGVRFLSMLFMVCATGLLYSWSTRLFNERVGLVAAGAFAVIAPTQVLGALATEDALALFLLALATWLVVLSRSGPFWPAVAAAPVALLAVVVKYGALFYLPWIVLLVVLVSLRHTAAAQAALRALPLGLAFLGAAGYYATAGASAPEAQPLTDLLQGWLNWIGIFTAFALLGVVMYTRRARMGEVPNGATPDPSPVWRLLLGVTMVLPALLAPFFLMAAPTFGTLWRPQFAFGALLAATMVGVGLVRLVGAHFHFPNLGIAAAVALLSLGMTQSEYEYTLWPSYENVAKVVDTQMNAEGRYLASDPGTFNFYMENYRASQWNATKDLKGGADGVAVVLRKRTYDLIVLQTPAGSATDKKLLEELQDGTGNYRMLTGQPFRLGWAGGSHQLWIPDLAHPVK
ncbi:glycosyltransferase family 39 protein [Actinocorallia aurantiaca]|uniref:DUF3824 domain-containing protein n=1 Tax=Actinocorallia aurantiaca TaxID=46204 RepID=A0ABN3U207_9ACTN